jgi:hypothetical protein
MAAKASLCVTFSHENGSEVPLDPVTAAQVLSWPCSQPPFFRPMGDFYLTSHFSYSMNLLPGGWTQLNLDTQTPRKLSCAEVTAASPPWSGVSSATVLMAIAAAGADLSLRRSDWFTVSQLQYHHYPQTQPQQMQQAPVSAVAANALAAAAAVAGGAGAEPLAPESEALAARLQELQAAGAPCCAVLADVPPRVTKVILRSGVLWQGNEPDVAECVICYDALDDGMQSESGPGIKLSRCGGHGFHVVCLAEWFKSNFNCPMCKIIYDVLTGNQPENGMMQVSTMQQRLPGFEQTSTGMFVITYSFPSGIQTSLHPHPGMPYTGDTRMAYLPHTPVGEEVLKLLQVAWQRRLIFAVGESTTLGPAGGDRIIWNGIHHKISFTGAHGFPDPTYLDRVKEELVSVGVVSE